MFKKERAVGFRAILFLICAVLLMLANHYSATVKRTRSNLSVVVTPIQYIVSSPIRAVNWLVDSVSTRVQLVGENTRLKSKVLTLQAKLKKQYVIEAENKALKALLQSSSMVGSRMMEAELLAVAPDPFVQQVVVNRGSGRGTFVGQPVLDAYGVMGQVVQAGPLTSRVLLITDPKSSIPVQVRRNGVRAIASGDSATGMLRLRHVIQTADMKAGDELVTSGLGQRYPFGYPVGKVISVEHPKGSAFLNVIVQPLAHLHRSRLVLLVWPHRVKIEKSIQKALIQNSQRKRGVI